MLTEQGELFLGSSVCDGKYRTARVEQNEPPILGLGNLICPVTFNCETDPVAMDRSLGALELKQQYTDLEALVNPRSRWMSNAPIIGGHFFNFTHIEIKKLRAL